MSDTKNERWWEFYFIRYFVGTVFGMALIAFLNFDENSPLFGKILFNLHSATDLNFSHTLALGAIGLAFCYISSAPILVFHALRGNFKPIYKCEVSFLAVGCWCSLVLVLLATLSFLSFSTIFPSEDKFAFGIVSLSAFTLIFGLQILLYLYSWSSKGNVFEYYKSLATERSKRKTSEMHKEYIESYKHLREHGNAFFIIIMEISLAIMLFAIENPMHSIFLVALWITPAFIVWFIGTYLEFLLESIEN